MKELKTIKYKDLTIVVKINPETGCFYASCLHMTTNNGKVPHCGYETMKEAIDDIINKIDSFLSVSPSSWKELAQELTNSLCWNGYEDAYVDENVLEGLVTNFLRVKQL